MVLLSFTKRKLSYLQTLAIIIFCGVKGWRVHGPMRSSVVNETLSVGNSGELRSKSLLLPRAVELIQHKKLHQPTYLETSHEFSNECFWCFFASFLILGLFKKAVHSTVSDSIWMANFLQTSNSWVHFILHCKWLLADPFLQVGSVIGESIWELRGERKVSPMPAQLAKQL